MFPCYGFCVEKREHGRRRHQTLFYAWTVYGMGTWSLSVDHILYDRNCVCFCVKKKYHSFCTSNFVIRFDYLVVGK